MKVCGKSTPIAYIWLPGTKRHGYCCIGEYARTPTVVCGTVCGKPPELLGSKDGYWLCPECFGPEDRKEMER